MLELYLGNGAKSAANNNYYSELNTDPAKKRLIIYTLKMVMMLSLSNNRQNRSF